MRIAVDNLKDRAATGPETGSTNQKEPRGQKNRRAGIRPMFALVVHYLTGRAVATDAAWREAPEWPPHPARLFFALVEALHAGGNESAERRAVEWLGEQAAPELVHSEK